MGALNAVAMLIAGNLMIWAMALFLGGQLLPDKLQGLYTATSIYSRAPMCGLAYIPAGLMIIIPFIYQPVYATFVQAIFNAGYVVMLGMVMDGKAFTLHIGVASVLVAASSVYLSWALLIAPKVTA